MPPGPLPGEPGFEAAVTTPPAKGEGEWNDLWFSHVACCVMISF